MVRGFVVRAYLMAYDPPLMPMAEVGAATLYFCLRSNKEKGAATDAARHKQFPIRLTGIVTNAVSMGVQAFTSAGMIVALTG